MQGSPQKKQGNCFSACTDPSGKRCWKWCLTVLPRVRSKQQHLVLTACMHVCVCVCVFSLAVPQLLALSVHHV